MGNSQSSRRRAARPLRPRATSIRRSAAARSEVANPNVRPEDDVKRTKPASTCSASRPATARRAGGDQRRKFQRHRRRGKGVAAKRCGAREPAAASWVSSAAAGKRLILLPTPSLAYRPKGALRPNPYAAGMVAASAFRPSRAAGVNVRSSSRRPGSSFISRQTSGPGSHDRSRRRSPARSAPSPCRDTISSRCDSVPSVLLQRWCSQAIGVATRRRRRVALVCKSTILLGFECSNDASVAGRPRDLVPLRNGHFHAGVFQQFFLEQRGHAVREVPDSDVRHRRRLTAFAMSSSGASFTIGMTFRFQPAGLTSILAVVGPFEPNHLLAHVRSPPLHRFPAARGGPSRPSRSAAGACRRSVPAFGTRPRATVTPAIRSLAIASIWRQAFESPLASSLSERAAACVTAEFTAPVSATGSPPQKPQAVAPPTARAAAALRARCVASWRPLPEPTNRRREPELSPYVSLPPALALFDA